MNQVDMIRCRLIDSHSINHNTIIRMPIPLGSRQAIYHCERAHGDDVAPVLGFAVVEGLREIKEVFRGIRLWSVAS